MDETVFSRALQCFRNKAHGLGISNLPSTEVAIFNQVQTKRLTISSNFEIEFQSGKSELSKAPGAFFAKGAGTLQNDIHIFQFSRCLEDSLEAEKEWEARQFELFLCIYDTAANDIPWLM
jgi:hypothetical protein